MIKSTGAEKTQGGEVSTSRNSMIKVVTPGYKQTKVGVIPEDWDVVKLGDVGDLYGGGTPSTGNKEYWQGNIPWISSSDLIDKNIYEIKKHRFINEVSISESATKKIPRNSILIVSRVGVGKVAINDEVLCTSQDFQCLVPTSSNSVFLAYLIKEKTKLLISFNQGTSIKGFVKSDLRNLKIPLPPLKEQQKIAQVLATWDNAISKQETLIKAKEELKKGLMQKLLSGEVRFGGGASAPQKRGEVLTSQNSKTEVLPPEWEEVRLGDVATFHKGKGISKKDISDSGNECIRYGELYTKYSELIEDIISKTSIPKEELFLSKVNDILIPASGETAIDLSTASCVLKEDIGLGGDINVIRAKVDGVFLAYYLNVIAKTKIASLAQGVSVIHLYASQLKSLKLNLPSKQEQQKIAQVLTLADKEIDLLKNKLEALKEQKRGLMQRLLSGEVRVGV